MVNVLFKMKLLLNSNEYATIQRLLHFCTTYKTYEKKLPVLPFIFGINNPVIARSKQ